MKLKSTLAHLPRTLFYNKQTSLALAMAVGLTAAVNTFASGASTLLNVVGTGTYQPQVSCQTDHGTARPVAVQEQSAGDSQSGRYYRVSSHRPVTCTVVSGSLMRSVTFQPGEKPAVDFRK